MSGGYQDVFAQALRDPNAGVPRGVTAHNSAAPHKRFTVYRNNVVVGLATALEARFPAVRKIVGEDFFRGRCKIVRRRASAALALDDVLRR